MWWCKYVGLCHRSMRNAHRTHWSVSVGLINLASRKSCSKLRYYRNAQRQDIPQNRFFIIRVLSAVDESWLSLWTLESFRRFRIIYSWFKSGELARGSTLEGSCSKLRYYRKRTSSHYSWPLLYDKAVKCSRRIVVKSMNPGIFSEVSYHRFVVRIWRMWNLRVDVHLKTCIIWYIDLLHYESSQGVTLFSRFPSTCDAKTQCIARVRDQKELQYFEHVCEIVWWPLSQSCMRFFVSFLILPGRSTAAPFMQYLLWQMRNYT